MLSQHIILFLLWILFGLFHSLFAAEGWKRMMQGFLKNHFRYYRLGYSAFSTLTLAAVIAYLCYIKTVLLWQVSIVERVSSIFGIVAGIVLMTLFTKKFFLELSGANVLLHSDTKPSLFKTGFYKYVRHPLYAATLLFTWSIFFFIPAYSTLISAACITLYTVIGIHLEEKKLIQKFGEDYISYRSETAMLIPLFINRVKINKHEKSSKQKNNAVG